MKYVTRKRATIMMGVAIIVGAEEFKWAMITIHWANGIAHFKTTWARIGSGMETIAAMKAKMVSGPTTGATSRLKKTVPVESSPERYMM